MSVLLQTKLFVPRPRPNLVSRPHLIKKLDAGRQGKLTLVSAPAGFGKTTLVAEWLQWLTGVSSEIPIERYRAAWLSLDAEDNDLTRFLTYLLAALRKVDPSMTAGSLEVDQSLQLPSFASVLSPLINDVTTAGHQIIFVLDDYQQVKSQPVHDAVTFLIDHLPDNMHLVIASRVDPPLPLARLRAQGQLNELRLKDLRFSPEETATFLKLSSGLDLTAESIFALSDRTEGWIAGLQLAAVSMRDRKDITDFVRAFTGSNRYIMDYLIEEVLERQPSHVQHFLLQTSILDRLSGPLCDLVAEMGDAKLQPHSSVHPPDARPTSPVSSLESPSQTLLEHLESANLFIVPLDDERCWYRYHHLFADLLHKRLQQTQADLVPVLHRRASEWFERNDQSALAIDHSLAASDFERAMQLIELVAEETLMRSEVTRFIRWVEALPDELLPSRPQLCVYYDFARLIGGRPTEEIGLCFRDPAAKNQLPSGQAAAMRALIAIYEGRIHQAVDLSRQALKTLPEDDLLWRHLAAWNMALSPLESDDFGASINAMEEMAKTGVAAGNVVIAAASMCITAKMLILMGNLDGAAAAYRQALEIATDSDGQPYPVAGAALLGLGEIAREKNDLESAERYLTSGIDLTRRFREFEAMDGHLSLALVKLAQGNWDAAHEAIQQAQQLLETYDADGADSFKVAAYQAWLWLAQGNIQATVRWAEDRGLTSGTALADLDDTRAHGALFRLRGRRRWIEYAVLTRLLIGLKRPGETLSYLEKLLQLEERLGLNGRLIAVLVLKALALQAIGGLDNALAALERALRLAEPEGYVRIFMDEGPPMAGLLRRAASRGVAPGYVNALLASFDQVEGKWTGSAPVYRMSESSDLHQAFFSSQPLTEPLSERELDVLRLLKTNLSVPEMAEELFIAVSTVRSHVKSIYGKLGVHRRREAVAKAEELGL